MNNTGTTDTNDSEPCPACYGMGVQTNKDGLRVLCPVCNGKRTWKYNIVPTYISESLNTSIKTQSYQ
jgi:DnaJ-class molecular chaperone